MTRKYDVFEIDQLRKALTKLAGWTQDPPQAQFEERLRTYMLNGTDPVELDNYVALVIEQKQHARRVTEAELLLKQHACQHDWHPDYGHGNFGQKPVSEYCSKCRLTRMKSEAAPEPKKK